MVEITNVDSHKLMYHPERVAEYKSKKDCYPIYIEIGLTNACNHKCVFCALDYLENGGIFFNKEVLLLNLKLMAEKGVKSIMFAGEGEPLLHKDIGLFVQKAKEYGIDISITTNGILFDESKIEQCLPYLSWIRFSIDAGTPESYAKIHGTNEEDFLKLMNNIQNAVEFKNNNKLDVTIGAQFLMISHNLNEAKILAEKLKEIGTDNLQIKPYSHHPKSLNDFSVGIEEQNRIRDELKHFDSENFKILFRKSTIERINDGINYPECYGLPFFVLIDSKGNVIPCNLHYGTPEFIYGNLYEKNFQEIWESERRKMIIKKLKEKGVSECRKGCRLDSINRYLHRLKNPLGHDNFI
ncbi:radical SAM protein [Candidatus Pacearchaeota archaeon]|nr:radical SAM protein [Candidatus Pacearchaeota archaeon]